jgi:hypothetical protein
LARDTEFDVAQLCESIDGTCNTLGSLIDELWPNMSELDLNNEDWNFINNTVFHCDECGWWYGVDCWSEEENVCSDCFESKEN